MIDRFEIRLLGPTDCWRDVRNLPPGAHHMFCVDYRANGEWRHYNLPLTTLEPEHWQSQIEAIFNLAQHTLVDIERENARQDSAPKAHDQTA